MSNNMKMFFKVLGCLFLASFAASVITGDFFNDAGRTNAAKNANIVKKNTVEVDISSKIPSEQKKFIDIFNNYKNKYKSAENDLQRKLFSDERNVKLLDIYRDKGIEINKATLGLAMHIKENSVVDWLGKIIKISTTESGFAHVELQLVGSQNITIENLDDEIEDISVVFSLIRPSTPLYKKIAMYSAGDIVKFSGSFYNQNGGIFEGFYIDKKSMQMPHFVFRFGDIDKI